MYEYLVDHALRNVWCTPNQDHQAILKPVRITPPGGSQNKAQVLFDRIDLPTSGEKYHVFQIGQLHPKILGLFPSYMQWKKLSVNCTEESMICDVYDISGLQYPRFQIWYMVTKNKNLIFAIRKPQKNTLPIDFYKPSVYIRVYSNEFFNSHRASLNPNYIKISGKYIGNSQDILDLQSEMIVLQSKIGHVFAYVNGYKVHEITPLNTKVGDVAEYVYDSTIKAIYDFKIDNLRTFVSILDSTRKYLLHYPGTTDIIDYQDDIDVFLIKTNGTKHKGVFHHKNQELALRNVTHKDYSVSVDLLNAFASYQPSWTDLDELTVRLHIRHSGYDRSLVYEQNRIHELYKLTDTKVMNAFLGIDSTLVEFRAETLENSFYTKLMGSDISEIDLDMVEKAYGYNSITKVLADTPKRYRIESGNRVVDVNYGLIERSIGFEYDDEGVLLGFKNHTGTSVYLANDQTVDLVQQISGHGSSKLDETYAQTNQTLDPDRAYRFYKCRIVGGFPNNEWEEVPRTSGEIAIINNELTWLLDSNVYYTLVRSDHVNLVYDKYINMVRGLLTFSLTSVVNKGLGDTEEVMSIPMGRLDLFLNGKYLIEDLDYFVKFPEIVICNKEYLVDPETEAQKITVRFMGHPDENLDYEKKWDFGFIDHGLLSNNNRFDLRDDRVLQITVDGSLYLKEELEYKESDNGVNVPDALNGSPYLIRDIIPRITKYTKSTEKDLRLVSEDIDGRVSDYMTYHTDDPDFTTPNVTPGYYRVYSPFLSRVIDDLLSGVINDPRLQDQYGNTVVEEILQPYEYLLEFDPTIPNNQPDDRYVIIDAYHLNNIIDINIYQYKFIDKVVKVYLNNKIELSHLLRLVQFGT